MPVTAPSLIARSKESFELWQVVIPPDCPPPDLKQFIRWCNRFTGEQMERAILRVASKFEFLCDTQPDIPAPELLHRYTTGLLLNYQVEDAQNQ
jgi:hypothetical protein